jgi:hypothetical protein
MKSIKLTIYILLISHAVFGQELIRNGNFEGGNRPNVCFTTPERGFKPFEALDFWHLAQTNPANCGSWPLKPCQTADWIDTLACSLSRDGSDSMDWPLLSMPQGGSHGRFCGMWTGNEYVERIRVELTKPLSPNKMYQLKVRVATGNYHATDLGIRLSVNFTKFGEHWNASPGGGNAKLRDITQNTSALSIKPKSAHKWYDLYYEFKPNDADVDGGVVSDLKNIVLWAESPDTNENCYVVIDDVHLFEIDPCQSICTPDTVKKPLCFGYYKNNVFIPNGIVDFVDVTGHKPLNMIIANATDLYFHVVGGDGSISYKYHVFDVNGLKDTGQSDFLFMYHGEDKWGGTFQDGVYGAYLKLTNCQAPTNSQNVFETKWDLTIRNSQKISTIPQIKNSMLENCCPDSLDIQNKVYKTNENESANTSIIAATIGAVEVRPFVKVHYGAGETIKLGGKFWVRDFGEFKASIQPCQAATLAPVRVALTKPTEVVSNPKITIFPNPTSNYISIKFDNRMGEIATARIYDLSGRKLYDSPIRPDINAIDIAHFAQGIYIIELETGGTSHKAKFIKQ